MTRPIYLCGNNRQFKQRRFMNYQAHRNLEDFSIQFANYQGIFETICDNFATISNEATDGSVTTAYHAPL